MRIFSIFLFLTCIACLCVSHQIHWDILDSISDKPAKDQFKLWHYFFQKSYDLNSSEGTIRFSNFQKNMARLKEFSTQKLSYTIGLGMFSDQDFDEEFNKKAIEIIDKKVEKENYFDKMADIEDADVHYDKKFENSKDWSYLYQNNYPVVDDKYFNGYYCGSHAQVKSFAYIINGYLWINDPKAEPVSEQYIRNCIVSEENCYHLSSLISYMKLIDENGVPLAKDIKWEEKKGVCKEPIKPYKKIVTERWKFCIRYGNSSECSNEKISAFLDEGPYVSQVDAGFLILHYRGGIFSAEECYVSSLAVIVTFKGNGYLKARLPFGDNYGEAGYIRVEDDNAPPHPESSCGLKSFAYSPLEVDEVIVEK